MLAAAPEAVHVPDRRRRATVRRARSIARRGRPPCPRRARRARVRAVHARRDRDRPRRSRSLGKLVDRPVRAAADVTVAGKRGLWIPGRTRSGTSTVPATSQHRHRAPIGTGPVVAAGDGVTYRIEGFRRLADARRVAETVRSTTTAYPGREPIRPGRCLYVMAKRIPIIGAAVLALTIRRRLRIEHTARDPSRERRRSRAAGRAVLSRSSTRASDCDRERAHARLARTGRRRRTRRVGGVLRPPR